MESGALLFIPGCISKPNTELTFTSSAFLDGILRVTYVLHPAGITVTTYS